MRFFFAIAIIGAFGFTASAAYAQRNHHNAAPEKPAKPSPKRPVDAASLWRDSKKGDEGALGGPIEGREVDLAWVFRVERIVDEQTAEIRSEVMVRMTAQELKDNGAVAGDITVKWNFRLKSVAVKDLHEDQALAKIPGRFIYQGRIFDSGNAYEIVGDAPKAANKPDEFRTWTGKNGKSIEAKATELTVTLTKRDGTDVEVPLRKLSPEDRKWIRENMDQ